MKEVIQICDRCGAISRKEPIVTLKLEIGRQPSAAGDSDPISEEIDICLTCLAEKVKGYFGHRNTSQDEAKRFMAYCQGKKL